MKDKPLISIVTVCLNNGKYLEQTIKSVINQTYQKIEYIIIDGGSTDKSLEIIKKYEDRITYWKSEPDQGIYDAMNKGSKVAQGDYTLYLNAGDYLYSKDAIEKVLCLALNEKEKPLLITARVIFAFRNELLNWFWPIDEKRMHQYNPPHQAILISKRIYQKIQYNLLFKIAGDTEFWEKLRQQGLFQTKYVDCILSVFRLGGISNQIDTEYHRYTERQIVNFLYGKTSNSGLIFRLLIGIIPIGIKRLLAAVLGERIYYKYILRSIYLFRKKFMALIRR